MSDSKIVKVEGLTSENATLLLAAAEELDLDSGVVATTSFGHFLVPEDVAKKAGVDYKAEDEADAEEAAAEEQRRADLDVLTGTAQRAAQANAGEGDQSGGAASEDEDIVRNEDGTIDAEKSKKPALVAAAEAAGLDTSGTKSDLAERLNAKE